MGSNPHYIRRNFSYMYETPLALAMLSLVSSCSQGAWYMYMCSLIGIASQSVGSTPIQVLRLLSKVKSQDLYASALPLLCLWSYREGAFVYKYIHVASYPDQQANLLN